MRALRRAATLTVAALFALPFAPAQAADGTNIDHVQTEEDGTVTALLATDGLPGAADLDSVSVSVNGETVDATAETIEAGTVDRSMMLVLDASNSMEGSRWEAATAAATTFIDTVPEDVEVGLLTFSGEVQSTVEPTTDHASLVEAIDAAELTSGTAVYDALIEATDLVGDEGARSLFLLSDGQDQGKGASLDEAAAAAAEAGVIVDVVSMDQKPAHLADMQTLATESGGQVIPADPQALAQVFSERAEAMSQAVVVTFTPPAGNNNDATLEISVDADGTTYTDKAFVSLGDSSGAQVKEANAGKEIVGGMGLLLGVAALGVGAAIVMAALFLGGASSRQAQLANRRVAHFTGGSQGAPESKGSRRGDKASVSLKDSALTAAEKLVKGDFETRLMQRLQGAGFSFTAAEWLLLHVGIALLAALVGLIFAGGVGLVLGLILGAVLPWFYLKFKHGRRLAAFNTQLAETLQMISGGLSAGLSMPQAIDTVVNEGVEPMAGELKRAIVESRLGVDLTDALEGIADRMESEDFSWVIMAIRIQREVGGNLAELLTTVSATLRERDYLRRQVKVLSAEGRFSAYILGAMPIVMFIYMLLTRREFIEPLWTTGMGMAMLGGAGVMLVLGFWMMSKIVKVEV